MAIPGTNNLSRSIEMCSLLFFTALALGCGGSGPSMQQVSGNVSTQQGKPCDNALVVFHPQEPERLNEPKPFANTDSQGAFQLTTQFEGDGALIGNYGVTIVWQGAAKELSPHFPAKGRGVALLN